MAGICETAVTIEQVAEQINKTLGTNATIESHDEIQIGIDQGFLSKVVKIHNIVWSDGDAKLPKSVVVKIPQLENFMKLLEGMKDTEEFQKNIEKVDVGRKTTRCEGSIYEMFSEADISPKLSTFYGSVMPAFDAKDDKADDGAPFILMEDFSHGHTADMMNGLTEKQFSEVAEVLADVQAWSIINRSKWIDNKDFVHDTAKFVSAESQEKAYKSFRGALEDNEVMKRVWGKEFGDTLQQSLDEFITSDLDLCLKFDEITGPLYFPNMKVPSVLVHGDCHPNNMMFDGDKMLALIDWQACHASHPFVDFIRLMTSAPTDTIRLEWWPKVFDQWYARITEKLGEDHKLSMSKQELWKLYEVAFYYISTLTVPMAFQIAGLKDGMVKNFVADKHIPLYMDVFCRMMRDGLEIKRRYNLK